MIYNFKFIIYDQVVVRLSRLGNDKTCAKGGKLPKWQIFVYSVGCMV